MSNLIFNLKITIFQSRFKYCKKITAISQVFLNLNNTTLKNICT